MLHIFLVAIGGAMGSVARYGVTRFTDQNFGAGFPWGTVIVNLAGSLLIGLLTALILGKSTNPEALRLFFVTGFLGGFTTFSAFSLEALNLVTRGTHWQALSYIGISVIAGLIAAFLGLAIGRALL